MTRAAPARAPVAASRAGQATASHGIYYSWQTSAQFGETGPFYYPQIQGSAVIGSTTIGNDVWNPVNPYTQALYAANPGQWEVVANFPPGNTAVASYPSIGQYYSDPLDTTKPFLLSGVTSFYSTFSEVQPTSPGIISEAAYDMWWNNYANEIMVQHDMVDPSGDRGAFETIDTAVFGGSGGVPVQTWNLGIFGSEIIWQLAEGSGLFGGGIQNGTVDLRAMLNWLADRGYLVNGLASYCNQIGYGWEICSTGGIDQLYRVNGFSSSFTYAPMETSPGLEVSGFAISGPGPGDVISNVTVTVTEYQSDVAAQPATIQLWDYSGTPAQIGPTVTGARSTSSANVSTATFYTVAYAQLATLRVRVYGNAATGYTESVDAVALTVNWSPGPPPPPPPPVLARAAQNQAVTIAVRAGRG